MSAIEIQRIWIAIEDIRTRASAIEANAAARMDGICEGADTLRDDLRGLTGAVDALSKRLEEHLSSSMKAYIDATLDVMKQEMRAYVRSLVPIGRL